MTEETAKIVIEKALAAAQTCVFGFQGGEPALAGLPFFEMFYAWVEKLKKPDQQVYYTLQTNGTLLDEAWDEIFKKDPYPGGTTYGRRAGKPTMKTGEEETERELFLRCLIRRRD